MADFKLGILGSEVTLPVTMSATEMPIEAEDAVEETEMMDGTFKYNIKPHTRRTFPLDWDNLTGTECDTLDAILADQAAGSTLNYINGYIGLAAGVSVVIASCPGRILKVPTSGRTTPRFLYSMTLKEVG